MADLTKALNFIREVDLEGTPRGLRAHAAEEDAGVAFNQAKNQAQVVGSGVFSFAQGVDKAVREATSDSALLAQLVANKKFDFETQSEDWFKAYLGVLEMSVGRFRTADGATILVSERRRKSTNKSFR